jgi:arginine-tRNA-protein transferase
MIYSFYDPACPGREGLGNFIILDHIRRAAEEGLGYVYLGYWVQGSARMQYKVRYRPLERLGPEGWERIGEDEQDRLIAAAASARREGFMLPDGGVKDGMPGGHERYRFSGEPAPAGSEE